MKEHCAMHDTGNWKQYSFNKHKETVMKNAVRHSWWLVAVVVGMLGTKAWASNTPADATITVTPVANVSLQIAPTTYAFGTQNVGSSVVTTSTLTLTNNGQVGVTVNKEILTDPSGWTASTATGADQYVLWVATQVYSSAPSAGAFPTSARMGAQGNLTQLLGMGGGSVALSPTGAGAATALWFRLDMPSSTSNSQAKTITVEFQGVAQ